MTNAEDELRPADYEEGFWKDAVRGKYTERYTASAKTIRLAPDVATSFPTDESVNEALRFIRRVMDDMSRLTKRCTGATTASGHEDVGQFFSDSDLLNPSTGEMTTRKARKWPYRPEIHSKSGNAP